MTICGSLGPICGSVITIGLQLGLGLGLLVMVSVTVADVIYTSAGESDKMRINHVIKTDQWRSF